MLSHQVPAYTSMAALVAAPYILSSRAPRAMQASETMCLMVPVLLQMPAPVTLCLEMVMQISLMQYLLLITQEVVIYMSHITVVTIFLEVLPLSIILLPAIM